MHLIGMQVAAWMLGAFSVLAAVDGVGVHLWRLRLHARPESWVEHVWHTARSVVMVPLTLALFAVVSGGALLWAGVALVLVDQVFEWLDAASEREARRGLGGLSSFEYALHLLLTTVRAAAVTAVLVTKPAEAWAWGAPWVFAPMPSALWALIPLQAAVGASVMALLHVALAVRHCPLRACARS